MEYFRENMMSDFGLGLINFAPTAGILFLLIFLFHNATLEKQIKRAFFLLLGLEVLDMIIVTAELKLATLPEPTTARLFLSAANYALLPTMPYLTLMMGIREKGKSKLRMLLFLPILLNLPIAFSVFFTDAFYSFTADNVQIRGPLGHMMYLAACFYLFYLIIYTIKNAKKQHRLEVVIIIAISTLLVITMILEAVYSIRTIGRTSIVLSTVFYYMFFQTQVYKESIAEGQKIRRILEHSSRTDGLTGLLNKKAFLEELQGILKQQSGNSIALLFFDLDHFKDINDSFGHMIGDDALKVAATKLRKTFRKADLVGRFGGDEFCVLLKDISTEALYPRLDEILEEMKLEYTDGKKYVTMSVSVGVAYLVEGKKAEYEPFLELADEAVYEAKHKGRCGYVVKEYA